MAQGCQHVLCLKSTAHIADRELALQQRGRVQPEAKGQGAAAKQRHIGHSVHALQSLLGDLIHPAAQKLRAVAPLLSAEAEHHQQIVGAAAHLDSQAGHLSR